MNHSGISIQLLIIYRLFSKLGWNFLVKLSAIECQNMKDSLFEIRFRKFHPTFEKAQFMKKLAILEYNAKTTHATMSIRIKIKASMNEFGAFFIDIVVCVVFALFSSIVYTIVQNINDVFHIVFIIIFCVYISLFWPIVENINS